MCSGGCHGLARHNPTWVGGHFGMGFAKTVGDSLVTPFQSASQPTPRGTLFTAHHDARKRTTTHGTATPHATRTTASPQRPSSVWYTTGNAEHHTYRPRRARGLQAGCVPASETSASLGDTRHPSMAQSRRAQLDRLNATQVLLACQLHVGAGRPQQENPRGFQWLQRAMRGKARDNTCKLHF